MARKADRTESITPKRMGDRIGRNRQWIFHGVKMYNLDDIAMYIEREGGCYYETGNVFRIAQ